MNVKSVDVHNTGFFSEAYFFLYTNDKHTHFTSYVLNIGKILNIVAHKNEGSEL